MAVRSFGSPCPRWLALLRRIERKQRQIAAMLARAEERASELEWDLVQLREAMPGIADGAGAPPTARLRMCRDLRVVPTLRRLAESGVTSLALAFHPNGSVRVRVDDDAELVLSPRLGQLLALLYARGLGDDTQGGWKPLEQLAAALAAKSNRPCSRHAVTQALSRLRHAFEKAGINPFLVQTQSHRGARLALRADRADSSAPEL